MKEKETNEFGRRQETSSETHTDTSLGMLKEKREEGKEKTKLFEIRM